MRHVSRLTPIAGYPRFARLLRLLALPFFPARFLGALGLLAKVFAKVRFTFSGGYQCDIGVLKSLAHRLPRFLIRGDFKVGILARSAFFVLFLGNAGMLTYVSQHFVPISETVLLGTAIAFQTFVMFDNPRWMVRIVRSCEHPEMPELLRLVTHPPAR